MGMTGGLSAYVKMNVKPIGAFKSGLIRQVVFEGRGLKVPGTTIRVLASIGVCVCVNTYGLNSP